jgi:glycosyltransferase involved in cell wall biosynthesis
MAGGGAERGALKLAEGLADRGFAVDLVLARAEGPRLAEIPPSVRLVDLGARRVLTCTPALMRYLRSERPQAVASVLDHANVLLLCARRLSRYRGRIVVIEQNTLSEAATNGSTRRARMMPRLAARFYPWADHVVAVSAGVADDLERATALPEGSVKVIFNPIITPDLAAHAQAPVDHPWFEEKIPVLVAAGRLRPQKDFPTLIEAFARVRKERRARLLILGDGPDREALVGLVQRLGLEEDVSLPGATPNPYAYMARAAAFVLSSRWEGLPTVLIEALGCGAPVISTDCPSGPREILEEGRYGLLVPVGDADALAAAMIEAVDGRLERAPDASWRPYELGAVVDEYLRLLVPAA